MENASKALIIAGAIIISILIIGLGVFIYSGAADTVNSSNLNSEQARSHNEKFTHFFGDKVSASQVKALMKEVVTNNVIADKNDELSKIHVKVTAAQDDFKLTPKAANLAGSHTTTEVTSAVRDGYTYKVNVIDDSASDKLGDWGLHGYYKSGYIRTIEIQENSRSTT